MIQHRASTQIKKHTHTPVTNYTAGRPEAATHTHARTQRAAVCCNHWDNKSFRVCMRSNVVITYTFRYSYGGPQIVDGHVTVISRLSRITTHMHIVRQYLSLSHKQTPIHD